MADYQVNAQISARQDLNEELAIFRVKPEGWTLPEFKPGQYAELALIDPDSEAKTERRSYSIASAPSVNDSLANELEFYVVRVEGGYLTPRLFNLQVGDKIWLGPKIKGKFTLESVPAGKDLVMLSTGTGLAPFLSMLREHELKEKPWRSVCIIHGARLEKDLGYRAELEARERDYPWFKYIPSLTRDLDNTAWQGPRGRVQQIIQSGLLEQRLGRALSVEDTHFLLCGNPQMIDEVELLLGEKGFRKHSKKEPGNVHVERYW